MAAKRKMDEGNQIESKIRLKALLSRLIRLHFSYHQREKGKISLDQGKNNFSSSTFNSIKNCIFCFKVENRVGAFRLIIHKKIIYYSIRSLVTH